MAKHIIIKSKNGVYHRLGENLYEVSMNTGRHLRYGLGFYGIEDIKERGFNIVDEVPATKRYPFGYYKDDEVC